MLLTVFAPIKLMGKLLPPSVQGAVGAGIVARQLARSAAKIGTTGTFSSVDLWCHRLEMMVFSAKSHDKEKSCAVNFIALNLSICSWLFRSSESASFAYVFRPVRALMEKLLSGSRPILINAPA